MDTIYALASALGQAMDWLAIGSIFLALVLIRVLWWCNLDRGVRWVGRPGVMYPSSSRFKVIVALWLTTIAGLMCVIFAGTFLGM